MGPGMGGGMGAALQGGPAPMGPAGAGAPDQNLQALMQKIRTVVQGVQDLAASSPALAEGAERINQILKEMVVQAAQQQSMQTASGMAVPGGGGA